MAKVTPRTNIKGAHEEGVELKSLSPIATPSILTSYWFYGISASLVLIGYAIDFNALRLPDLKVPVSLSSTLGFVVVFLTISMIYSLSTFGRPYLKFAYNCFIKPFFKKRSDGIDSNTHQSRLEEFYEGQADIYDVTRKKLLRGRSTMLKLCAAQLRQVYPMSELGLKGNRFDGVSGDVPLSPPLSPTLLSGAGKRFAWIDVGGGTGENIERMNNYFPISNFERVYLVDITPSLCEVARQRFARLGWKNVKVLCMDASKFEIPAEDNAEDLDIALITMSYSLTMIETSYCYPIIDRLSQVLAPTGIFGVADFYVSSKRSADSNRQLSWFTRWFWAIWFDSDNVYLTPGRREYLEHKFKTVKTISALNHMIKPFVRIPYYVWIGAQKAQFPSMADFSLNAGTNNVLVGKKGEVPAVQVETPEISERDTCLSDVLSDEEDEVEFNTTEKEVSTSHVYHVTPDHVHGQGYRWRQHFDPALLDRFSTYLYAFTWEDPRVDLQFLDLNRQDKMFVISSGGCNVLEYAVKVGPQRIHAVDLNPCQNNMLELKLAALTSFDYDSYWKLLGEGYIENFSTLLDTHLSPNLSPYAYDFWKKNANFKSLFKTGGSGLAIRVFDFIIKLRRLRPIVDRMCNADTLEEQTKIWNEELRPHILNKWLIHILNNDKFLWSALGVPPAQMQMLLEEGSAHAYMENTIDPVIKNSLLKDDNYFFYMPLMLSYNKNASGNPAYLTEEGYNLLRAEPDRIDAIKIHTDYILNVLKTIPDGDLTKVILMDHIDWFSIEDATSEIEAVHKKMAVGGRVFWRSAGKYPWYNEIFSKTGFNVSPCQIREGDTMYIDRVNMYASFWVGVKQ